jgi:hypothetical protein
MRLDLIGPHKWAGALPPWQIGLMFVPMPSCLLESSFTCVGLFSLCKHDMWAFLSSF